MRYPCHPFAFRQRYKLYGVELGILLQSAGIGQPFFRDLDARARFINYRRRCGRGFHDSRFVREDSFVMLLSFLCIFRLFVSSALALPCLAARLLIFHNSRKQWNRPVLFACLRCRSGCMDLRCFVCSVASRSPSVFYDIPSNQWTGSSSIACLEHLSRCMELWLFLS